MGIIIKNQPFSENDKLISIMAKTGKLEFLARGARLEKSKLGGHLELLNLIDFDWISGRYFKILTSAQGVNFFINLRSAHQKILSASYYANLADKLTVENQDPKIFDLLFYVLSNLDNPNFNFDLDALSRFFEFRLLEILGWQPVFKNAMPDGMNKFLKKSGLIKINELLEFKNLIQTLGGVNKKIIEQILSREFKLFSVQELVEAQV